MKKILISLRMNWGKILIGLGLLIAVIGSIYFLAYCFTNYQALESFSRKQISAQMALLLPMFVIVQLITLPVMFGIQYYLMQGGPLSSMGKDSMQKAKANIKWSEVIGMEDA